MATLANGLRLAATLLLPTVLLLTLALPVAAAQGAGAAGGTVRAQLANGTICGSVTAYLAPSGSTDGSITINGVTDPVDAAATITAEAAAALSATLPLTTCLNLTVTGSGDTTEVTGIAIAASGQLCGPVTAVGTGAARVFSIGGAALPTTVVNAGLAALLEAAITANASVCLDVTVDASTGAVTAAADLDATFTLCGSVVASGSGDARTYTVAGLAIPAAQLSASDRAVLELALANNANACAELVIVNSVIESASARADVCVTVTAVTANSLTADGVTIPLSAGVTVPSEVRAGATLAIRVAVSAGDVVSISVISLDGCTASGTAAAGAAASLPNTAAGNPAGGLGLVLGGLLLLGGGALARRRMAVTTA